MGFHFSYRFLKKSTDCINKIFQLIQAKYQNKSSWEGTKISTIVVLHLKKVYNLFLLCANTNSVSSHLQTSLVSDIGIPCLISDLHTLKFWFPYSEMTYIVRWCSVFTLRLCHHVQIGMRCPTWVCNNTDKSVNTARLHNNLFNRSFYW